MDNTSLNSVEKISDGMPPKSATLGHMLREAREKLGLSISDVANQIKFAPRQIEAIEADDYKTMPEAAFLRGFVRSYGKLLHLDLQILFDALPATKVSALSAATSPGEISYSSAQTVRRQNFIWLVAALIFIIIALAFAIANLNSPAKSNKELIVDTPVVLPKNMVAVQEKPPEVLAGSTVIVPVINLPASQPSVVAIVKPEVVKPPVSPISTITVAPKPVVVVPLPQAHPPVVENRTTIPIDTLLGTNPANSALASTNAAEGDRIRIVFSEKSWTKVTDKQGKILSSKVNLGGTELHLDGQAPFILMIGRAHSVQLFYKGKSVDLAPYTNQSSEVARITLE